MWGMHGYGMPGFWHGGTWLAGGGFFLGIVLLALLITVIVLLVRRSSNNGNRTDNYDEAMEILKRRYARGEISAEEFEEMKQRLK